ncbi:glycine-rich domain-containing protein [Piscinibacter terrae]|nr:hypothetical protein [Albitalea terrae]
MTLSNPKKTLAQTVAAIQAMDLSMIKFKATRKEDGYGWSDEYADAMELAYKRYLTLHAKYPEMTLAPEQDIDRFWHMHILDTRKYAADCDATFGRFLHHFPYLGLRGEEDAKALDNAFDKMQELYLKEFGEEMPKASAWCAVEPSVKAAWCAVEPSAQGKAAWCAVEPSAEAKAAWCAVEPQAEGKAAWCAVEPSAKAKAAWCAVEPTAVAKAAWCAVEPTAKSDAAWCAVEPVKAEAAWCAIEPATREAAAAWCALEPTEPRAKAAWCAVEPSAKAA